VIAYKFLGRGAIGLYSGFRWPVPHGGEPGGWVEAEAEAPLAVGERGVHACAPHELVHWIDDELWLVELADPVAERHAVLLSRRGRLLRRIDEWTEAAADAFAESCVWSVRDAALEALRRAGQADAARELAAAGALDRVGRRAAALRRRSGGPAADALAYLADAVELARGGRPERYGERLASASLPSKGAIAANLGFAAAHALGALRAGAAGEPADYEAGVGAERERQRRWLTERLGLEHGFGG
jgi:hypothetical protein